MSQISQIRYVEKNLSCGEISNLYAWQMWRNLKFIHMWSNLKFLHMTDVEKSEVSPHLACVWCGECLYIYTCYAVLSKNWFCCDLRRFVAKSVLLRFTHFCVEKNLTKNCVCGEKMTNIRYVCTALRNLTSCRNPALNPRALNYPGLISASMCNCAWFQKVIDWQSLHISCTFQT